MSWGGIFPLDWDYEGQIGAPAVLPDGSVLLSTFAGDGSVRVIRFRPDGSRVRVAGVRGLHEISGDGGPAARAGLGDAIGLLGRPDGGFFISDEDRIRLVDAWGVISSFVAIPEPFGLAPLPDGGLAVGSFAGSNALYLVDPGGTARQIARFSASEEYGAEVGAGPGGEIYVVLRGNELVHVAPDGSRRRVLRLSGAEYSRINSDALGRIFVSQGDPERVLEMDANGVLRPVVPARAFRRLGGDLAIHGVARVPDGSIVLVTTADVFVYPSATSSFYALAIRKINRARRRIAVGIEATGPGALHVDVLRRGRRVAHSDALVSRGASSIAAGPLSPGRYKLVATLRGQGNKARATVELRVQGRSGIRFRAEGTWAE